MTDHREPDQAGCLLGVIVFAIFLVWGFAAWLWWWL